MAKDGPQTPRKIQVIYCPDCGTQNEHYRARCYHCGSALVKPDPVQTSDVAKRVPRGAHNTRDTIIAIVILIVFFAFFICLSALSEFATTRETLGNSNVGGVVFNFVTTLPTPTFH